MIVGFALPDIGDTIPKPAKTVADVTGTSNDDDDSDSDDDDDDSSDESRMTTARSDAGGRADRRPAQAVQRLETRARKVRQQ